MAQVITYLFDGLQPGTHARVGVTDIYPGNEYAVDPEAQPDIKATLDGYVNRGQAHIKRNPGDKIKQKPDPIDQEM